MTEKESSPLKVLEFKPTGEDTGPIVRMLESLLERAKNGEIGGIAVAGICIGDNIGNFYTGYDWVNPVRVAEIFAAVEMLKQDIIEDMRAEDP